MSAQIAIRIMEGGKIIAPWRFFSIHQYRSYTTGDDNIVKNRGINFESVSFNCKNYTLKEAAAGRDFQ
jgi:hypothetical protein